MAPPRHATGFGGEGRVAVVAGDSAAVTALITAASARGLPDGKPSEPLVRATRAS